MRSLALVFIVCSSLAVATAQTILPDEKLQLTIDAARFRGGDDEHSYVEVYYAFPRHALTYIPDSGGFTGNLDITVLVLLKDSIVAGDRWLVPQHLQDTSATDHSMSLMGLHALQLPMGDYVMKAFARDRNDPSRVDSVLLRLPVRTFAAASPTMSDVEFASSIRQAPKEGQFWKNTLEVIPNPSGLYGKGQRCFYYAEAYNLTPDGTPGNYSLRSTVFDAVGREVISRERPKKNVGESSVLVDQIGVDKLRSGTYTLVLSLLDTAGRALTSSGKKFFVYNPDLGIDSTLLAGSKNLPLAVFLAMGEPELDREFAWARYEADDAERDNYRALQGADAKRRFLSEFWRKRSPGRREEYIGRVQFANVNFSVGAKEGYRADRGRVYIVYGPPDDIDRHPSETESRPYEIWAYHSIQGGVIFVFVQRNPGGDHELVHSTHRNELHDENWDRVGITR